MGQATTRLFTPWTATALGLILLLGLGFRLVIATQAPAFVALFDSADFFRAGYDLARSGDFSLPFKRAPLYPAFLAGVIASVGPSLEAAALIQHALGLVTVTLAYCLGALAFGRSIGLLAALGTAINGSLLGMEHFLVAEAIYTPLLLGSVLLLLLGLRSERTWLFVLAGLGLGLGALARPVAQAVLPLMLGAVVVQLRATGPEAARSRSGGGGPTAAAALPVGAEPCGGAKPCAPTSGHARRPWLLRAGLLCLGFLLITGPWVLRNRMVNGVATISGGLGDSLFERTHKYDRTFSYVDLGQPPSDPQSALVRRRVFELAEKYKRAPELRAALQKEVPLTEPQADDALRQVALQVIRQEPVHYLRSTLAMFLELALNPGDPIQQEGWWSRSRETYPDWPRSVRSRMEAAAPTSAANRPIVDALTGFYQDYRFGALIGVLFLIGAGRALAAGRCRGAGLLPLVVLSQLLLYVALDGPHTRYRFPLQPLISVLAAAGLTLLLSRAPSWAVGAAQPLRRRLFAHRARGAAAATSSPGAQASAAESPSAATISRWS